jgi:hypothetical protein
MREVQNTGASGYSNNRELLGAVNPALGFFAVDGCLIPYPSFFSLHGTGAMRLNLSCNPNSSENTVEREFPSPRSAAIYTVKAWRKRSIVERGK